MVMMLVSVLHQTKYLLSSAGDGLPKRCCLPKKVGPCKASIPRYYYNKDTEQCEAFTYGGCKGNRNNFKTLKQCNRVCHGKLL